jgi:hypothetical protein
MVITLGAVKEKEFKLIEQGEYVLTLSELDESMGQYGERLVWKWLVAPKDDPAAYICKANGDEYTLWAFTDPDVVIGTLTHEFAQAVTGRTLDKGDEPPTEHELLGGRCIAYITHYVPKTGKNAGKKVEKIVEGSVKPFRQAGRSARPEPEPDDDEPQMSRDELIAEIKKQTRRAALLDIEAASEWKELDLGGMGTQDLREGLETIQAAIAIAAES